MNVYHHALFDLAIARLDSLVTPTTVLAEKKQQGSQACRLLLQQFITQSLFAKQENVCFVERNLPYYLISTTNGEKRYLSFSHSQTHVAVLMASTPLLGLDIEDNEITHQVATRYFHANELAWLTTLPIMQQANARRLLWTFKEAYIKQQGNQQGNANQPIKSQLVAGLKVDITQLIPTLQLRQFIDSKTAMKSVKPSNKPLIYQRISETSNYYYGFLSYFNCALMIEFSDTKKSV